MVLCGERHRLLANVLPPFSSFGQPIEETVTGALPGASCGPPRRSWISLRSLGGCEGHQGVDPSPSAGPTRYATPDLPVSARTELEVAVGHAVTWNRSRRGAKCEDNMLLTLDGLGLMTETDKSARSQTAGVPVWRLPTGLHC